MSLGSFCIIRKITLILSCGLLAGCASPSAKQQTHVTVSQPISVSFAKKSFSTESTWEETNNPAISKAKAAVASVLERYGLTHDQSAGFDWHVGISYQVKDGSPETFTTERWGETGYDLTVKKVGVKGDSSLYVPEYEPQMGVIGYDTESYPTYVHCLSVTINDRKDPDKLLYSASAETVSNDKDPSPMVLDRLARALFSSWKQ